MLFALLFYLLATHALMDYALQSETIATCKCRGCDSPIARSVPWYYWLTAHTVLHGAAVGMVVYWFGKGWNTVAAYAVAETVCHWLIDFGKCEKWYSIHVDQGLHVLCKLVWFALLAANVTLD
ncbi:MAG TPA: DUF3307 domain-containing protein [Gemmata sp.]|nr:DUF3307 domain-containing protein [Gemmata sp.]